MVVFLGMMTIEYKSDDMFFPLLYAFHRTPFGKCLIAITDDDDENVTYLSFVDGDETAALEDLKAKWPLSRVSEDTSDKTSAVIEKIFHSCDSQLRSVRVLMKGTEFQLKIWRSLTRIPAGAVTTYEEVARMAGCDPKAAIAVGNAVSKNYVGYVVPCHRVTAKNKDVHDGKYAWGVERKVAILEYEKQLVSVT